jgi:predicted DNA-binding protein
MFYLAEEGLEDLVAGDDQVIEHADVDELQRIAQVAGDYTKCCKPHL